MKIFNRYGDLIYESNDYDKGWKGNHYNRDYYVPNGVYSYVITYTGFKSTEVKKLIGHVSLIR